MTQRRSRFREEIEIIPTGWVIAAMVAFLIIEVLFQTLFVRWAHDALPPQPWWTLLGVACALLTAASFLLVGYIYSDAKRRGMNALLWTLLALLLPKPIGFILYFLLRKPIFQPCPNCKYPIAGDFAYCAQCGYSLVPSCGSCGRALQRDFVCCPYCGKDPGAALPGVPAV
jgi:hypothetical protein